jgi:hypothetical protein
MKASKPVFTTFSEQDIHDLEPALKIGLLASINPQGLPHLTMISTLKAGSPNTVTWGAFTEGQSKVNVQNNPHTAFMVMTLDKRTWRGKAHWTHTAQGGEDFEWYNNVPMFRYNAYFGIHTVHYMDLLEHSGCQPLPMNGIIFAAVQTLLARSLAPLKGKEVMNPWTLAFFNKLDNLKFLTYVGEDGFPVIIPVIHAQAGSREHLLVSTAAYGDELKAIPTGAAVAVLGLALTMEDVLVRGVWSGIQRRAGVPCGTLQVDWVYNPMPPVPQQIYPPLAVQAVSNF